MKKLICTFLCLLIGIGIGIPLVYKNGDRLNAAEDNVGEEKIIDFEVGSFRNKNEPAPSLYLVSESNHLYFNETFNYNQEENNIIMFDIDGNPLEKVIKASGSSHSQQAFRGSGIALRSDNKLYVWGDNTCGQFGNGLISDEYTQNAILVDPGVSDIVSVLSTERTNFFVTANGDVYASGDNSNGQFGDGTTTSSTTFKKIPITDVKKLTRTEPNILYALKKDGTIYSWGGTVFDGINTLSNVMIPTQIYSDNNTDYFTNVVDINANLSVYGFPSVSVLTQEGDVAKGYIIGRQKKGIVLSTSLNTTVSGANNIGSVCFGYKGKTSGTGTKTTNVQDISFINDGNVLYLNQDADGRYYKDDGKILKLETMLSYWVVLTEKGRVFCGPVPESEKIIRIPLSINATKKDNTAYQSEEKYNDDIAIHVTSTATASSVSCQIEDPVGEAATSCADFMNNDINITAQNQRIYLKYIMKNDIMSQSFIVDLYRSKPHIDGYSTTTVNRLKPTETITITTPSDQSSWNTYSATITDSSGNTSDYTGGTLNEGTYTLTVTDSYGNTQNYSFEVKDNPKPTADFTPSSSTLTYGDNPTKANNTIGTFSLKYPDGEPTSTIKTIQLGTEGDESHFTVDKSGALKVKGNDLDAGTYRVTVSGTDGNDMAFTKTVSITVNKKDQNNYQITNNANYPLQVNQEIAITTSGNESGENETYTITSGNTVAQIVGNKFKLLSDGTFTLEATVGGNTNYNSKTVTKQITVSQLPTQNPPVSITSKDSFVYGDTYTPTYSGGQGSGAVSWTIENDNGTGAVLSNDKITVTGIGSFTLKVTKAGTSSYQESTATKVITVNKRKTIVKPKDVTKTVGQAFKDNGATYTPQIINGDNVGTLVITSKYPNNQAAGRYTDGIQASGLSNPNYEFEYQEGTLIINSNSLPNNGDGYYKVTGTKGKNNWYISDVQIATTNKNGYDEISKDGVNFQTSALVYSTDGDYPTDFYLRNSSTGIIAKAIRYQLKIDQTPPDVPTMSMKEVNKNVFARFINALSFGNWMNQAVQVTMTSTDTTSGIDLYEYNETSQSGTNTKTSTNGIVTYKDDVEITVKAKACDKAGNCSALSNDESIMIDTKAPTITGVKDKSEYKHYYLPRFVKVKDDYSGLSYSEYKKDGTMAGTIQNNVDEKINEVGEYEVYAIDNAGNEITITFKIVSLPDIETEIDGSDESKDIIDQIKDELEEIKDKIDETEKKDIEDWIKDAEDKWNSLRKKVVETDDKSAKVEGQGDTDFDPSVILIVDDITDQANDIPPLPRKAINVYDVYLQKGNVRIQPDGSIKVYLPYTGNIGKAMGGAIDSLANPIVYQIDEKDKVTELNCKREGNFVTFITDELLRYAISDENQDLNKDDDTCVVGPDGKPNTGDEVCGLPGDDGKQPEKKPDGSVEVPDGGKVEFPNGTEIDTPDGAIIHPDGSVTLPDGTEYDPDGNKKPNDACVVGPDGKPNTGDEVCGLPGDDGKQPEKKPDGSVEVPDGGKVEFPNGTEIDTPDGAIIHPDGSVTLPDGTEYDPDGNKKPSKQCKLDGIEINIDTDGDGYPDINLDLNGDCKPELNIDLDGDKIPDINIDSDGDGKADINIDKDDDGKADLNILEIKVWKPNKTVTVNGFTYGTMSGLKPYLNIDTDNDGKPNYNIDTNDDGIPDKNVLDNNSNSTYKNNLGGANTGDNTKWVWWWILLIITTITMIYAQAKKRHTKH